MWRHLGGPESPEKVLQRQRRFDRLQPSGYIDFINLNWVRTHG